MRHKYGVAPKSQRTWNGVVYDSKKEMSYAMSLDQLKWADKESERVVDIKSQVPYEIKINGIKICKYILDFEVTYADGRVEFVDAKGFLTPVYRLKKKLMLAIHKIEIKEV